MNRYATLLTGCAMFMSLPATLSLAAAPQAGLWAIAHAAPAQLGLRSESRKKADDLLRDAQGAIKAGEYDKAEALIGQAEKLKVTYDPLTMRLVDTPDKIRKLLAEERAKRGPAAKPASRFPSLLGGQPAQQPGIPGDPFQGAQTANPSRAAMLPIWSRAARSPGPPSLLNDAQQGPRGWRQAGSAGGLAKGRGDSRDLRSQ